MTAACPPIEVLSNLASLAADDPARRHAEECPRCHALLSAYGSFLAPPETLPTGARPAEAGRELSAFLRERILAGAPPSAALPVAEPSAEAGPAGDHGAAPGPSSPSAFWTRVRSTFALPSWRPWAAGLAVVLLVLGIRELGPGTAPETSGVLRSSTPGLVPLTAHVTGGTEAWDLSWSEAVGADAYRITIFDRDFRAVREQPASGTTLRLARTDPDLSEAAFFRIVATRSEEEIAASAPTPLP